MAITITKSLPATCFSSTIPDVEFSVSGISAAVDIAVDGERIYSETLFPVAGKICLRDLSSLLTPYARLSLSVDVLIRIAERTESGNGATASIQAKVIYCKAEILDNGEIVDAETFCERNFLTILRGKKVTAEGRLELLHYLGDETPTVRAYYTDDSFADFTPPFFGPNVRIRTIDVSAHHFRTEGKVLTSYYVRVGWRGMKFVIDFAKPEFSPALVFENSFGCDELIYCNGLFTRSPGYERKSAVVDGLYRNYDIKELRTFKADTGVLCDSMADWLDDLFRSYYVRLVHIKGYTARIGKEITITDSKSDVTSDDAEMPRFTFSFRYAQRNHNLIDIGKGVRIFDETFDYTFN